MSALAVNPVLFAAAVVVVSGAAWSWCADRLPRRDRHADFLDSIEADTARRK